MRSLSFALTLACVSAGCSSGPVKMTCKLDTECPTGMVCTAGVCGTKTPTCPDAPCTGGKQCISHHCYAPNCASTMCGMDQVCSSGQCTDVVCIGMSCPGGQSCVKGSCYDSQCTLQSCNNEEICQGGACVGKSCATVTCPSGQACVEGACQSQTCGTTTCNAATVCKSGSCVDARCVGVTCGTDEQCSGGTCVTTSCGSGTCGGGTVCGTSGTCVDALCANVACPSQYACVSGVCVPGLPDGGPLRGSDGGVAVIYGPDGGVIGVTDPNGSGGPLLLPDGGLLGAPCLPSQCLEIDCADHLDNDNNGFADCADSACSQRHCDDGDPCKLDEICTAGACLASRVLSCNTPPGGECFGSGTCNADATCSYPVRIGQTCQVDNVCYADGGCNLPQGIVFPFTPAHFDPTQVPMAPAAVTFLDGGTGTVDTTNSALGGYWGDTPPNVGTVSLFGGGSATVLSMKSFITTNTTRIVVTGNKPLIIAADGFVSFWGELDAAAHGSTPGPGGNHAGCNGANGGAGSMSGGTASGGGGAGASGQGAPGGAGTSGGAVGTGGGARGTSFELAGGCAGGVGGNSGGAAGAGGGAVQISATQGLVVTGHINVGGGGGKGGTGSASGGGGGGSGGIVFLESRIVAGAGGSIIASGGAGGQGSASDGTAGGDGTDAYNWRVISGGTPGGQGGSMYGGHGGSGGVRHFPMQSGGAGTTDVDSTIFGSGGGGGGAPGYVKVNGYSFSAVLPDGGTVQPCIFGQMGTPSCVVSPNLVSNQGNNCDNGSP